MNEESTQVGVCKEPGEFRFLEIAAFFIFAIGPTNDETLQYPWFLQHMNGPWILADIIRKYTDTTFPSPPKRN